MSHLKPYSDYKPSDKEWIGRVPTHWTISPLKRLLDIQNGADHKHIEADDGVPVYGSGGIFAFAKSHLYDGESVLLGRKGTIDKPLFVTGKFWTVDTMYWTKVRASAVPRYAYYLALTIPFDRYSTNTALPSMTKEVLNSHVVAYPPVAEQLQISAGLDNLTSPIDALIEKKTRFIELLKEKRQALVTRAVTKGLAANVKMKQSGVEWIGEVPQHWHATKLGFAVVQHGGKTPSKEERRYWGGDVPWVSPKDMKRDMVGDSIDKITDEAVRACGMKLFPPGTVLVVVRGMILAHSFPVAEASAKVTINQDIKALTPVGGMSPTFLRLFLQSIQQVVVDVLVAESAHGTRVLRTDIWRQLPFFLPPPEEQTEIVRRVWTESGKIESLVAATARSIDLLKERRSALITAAVTGQIDLQGAA